MSELSQSIPKNNTELEDFAVSLGEHCLKFGDNICYKQFVSGLITDLCADLDQKSLNDISLFIKRLSDTRTKQEKQGNVEHYINHKLSSSDDEGSANDNIYDDFM